MGPLTKAIVIDSLLKISESDIYMDLCIDKPRNTYLYYYFLPRAYLEVQQYF